MKTNYKIFGKEPISIVVEMGLGSCIGEWEPFADMLKEQYSILLYERAGIGQSESANQARTPENIADELHTLLKQIEHREKLILIGHSQGGLYAQAFCRQYPELVKGLILLDPLSAEDNLFREKLSPKEYKQSGVDKSANYKIMRMLAKCKAGFITKKMLKSAPPFYYYDGYTTEQINEILKSADRVEHAETAWKEYLTAHQESEICTLKTGEGFPDIPLILITHASAPAIKESMYFGRNSEAFATKIENMWQEIMKGYLSFSSQAEWIQADKSTHYIHLTEPELVITAIHKI